MTQRPAAFVLASTSHGALIVNRFDSAHSERWGDFGVGHQLLSASAFELQEVQLTRHLLECRRAHFGDGVVAVDAGANVGVHTVEWAKLMHGWGSVMAFEAQEVVFYALAGNIVLNNCLNATARWAALGEECGEILVPQPDYLKSGSFGSLELRAGRNEPIGQDVSYAPADCKPTPLLTLDSIDWKRLDFIKIDVEGMEAEVLRGARDSIARHHPLMLVEAIKCDAGELRGLLEGSGYALFQVGVNWIAAHGSDPLLAEMTNAGLVRLA